MEDKVTPDEQLERMLDAVERLARMVSVLTNDVRAMETELGELRRGKHA